MKKIYFVRHGESEANAAGLTSGSESNTQLTEAGQAQAKATGKKLKSAKIDLIISSPLDRAMETAKIIAEVTGYDPAKIIINKNFVERSVGVYSGRSDEKYLSDAYNDTLHPSAETSEHMHNRVVKGLEWVKGLDADRILIVSHGGISRVLRVIHQELPHTHMYKLERHGNAEIYEFDL